MKNLRAAVILAAVGLDFMAIPAGIILSAFVHPAFMALSFAAAGLLIVGALHDQKRARELERGYGKPPAILLAEPTPADRHLTDMATALKTPWLTNKTSPFLERPAALSDAQKELAAEDAAYKRYLDGLGDQ